MKSDTPAALPVLLVDDSPGRSLGKEFPEVGRDALLPGIQDDPHKLVDLRWIASSRQALAYRRYLWERGGELTGAFAPMVLIADFAFNENDAWDRAVARNPRRAAALLPYADDANPARLESLVAPELRSLARARDKLLDDGFDAVVGDAQGCFASAMILNDLRGWPVAAFSRTKYTTEDIAKLGLDYFEAHVRLGLHGEFRATDGDNSKGWATLLPAACKALRGRITDGLTAGTVEVGRKDLLRLCAFEGSGTLESLGSLSLASRLGTRQVGVRSLFLDCSDDDVAKVARDWARSLYALRRSAGGGDQEWKLESVAAAAVHDLWEYRMRHWDRVQARFALACGVESDASHELLGVTDTGEIPEAKGCDVRQVLDPYSTEDQRKLLHMMVLFAVTKLIGLRSEASASYGRGLGHGDAGADIVPNDVYFALAPIWYGRATPESRDPWDGMKKLLKRHELEPLIKVLLKEDQAAISPSDRGLMRGYAIDPVCVSRAWWRMDKQAKRLLGEPDASSL